MVDLSAYGAETIRIDRNGDWWYGEQQIVRSGLIRLFYRFLFKQEDGYFIVTPAERVRVEVEDAALLVVNMVEETPHCLTLCLNDDTQIPLNRTHLPWIDARGILHVPVRNGLAARFSQACHVELGLRLTEDGPGRFLLVNCGDTLQIESRV